jgi:polynucleotide 5'-kinase involved in rRNA processing
MVALQDVEGFALGLGVVEQVNHQNGTCVLRTPLPNQDGVYSLRCGTARWDLSSQREA